MTYHTNLPYDPFIAQHDEADVEAIVPPFMLRSPAPGFSPQHQVSQHRLIILIVDDDMYIGDLLKELLEDAGFQVLVAIDAVMAYRLAARHDPDLILTDYYMPIMDGVSLRHQLKDDPYLGTIPFALMSSRRTRLPGMEGVPFLAKPFDIDDVITFINRHVRQTRLHGDG